MIRLIALKAQNQTSDYEVIATRHFEDNERDWAERSARDIAAVMPGKMLVDLYHCQDAHSPSDRLLAQYSNARAMALIETGREAKKGIWL